MADTIVTNTPAGTSDSGAAGLVVALVIVIALVVGGIFLYQRGAFRTAAPAGTTNINVSVPTPATGSGSTGGSATY